MKQVWRIGIALAIAGGVALAQPQPAKKVAEQHFIRGNTAYNLGQFDEAIVHFTKAYEAWQRPEFLYNIAQSYRLARNCKQALHFYKRFRSLKDNDPADPLSPKKREEVDRFITQLTECAAKADTSASVQPDAVVHPDNGAPVGKPVVPAAAQPSPAADAEDGEEEGDGEGEEELAPTSSGRSMKVAGLVTAGAGVGLVITGAVFGMMASSAQSDVEKAVENGAPYDPELDAAGRRNAKISMVTLGVGAAAVVTGGVLYFLGARSAKPASSTEASLRIVPTVSAETAGLTLDVRY